MTVFLWGREPASHSFAVHWVSARPNLFHPPQFVGEGWDTVRRIEFLAPALL
jgi:hypothetical protein